MNTIMKRTMEERINDFCNRETKALADITFRYETACATTEVCFEERIYNSYACKMKFKSVLEDINDEIKEIKLVAESGELPREICIEQMELFMGMKRKVRKARKEYSERMEGMEQFAKSFERSCKQELAKAEIALVPVEAELEENFQNEAIMSEHDVDAVYRTAEDIINNAVPEILRLSEVFLVPKGVLNCYLEKIHTIKENLVRSKESFKDAFRKLEQELVAQ